MSFIIFECVLGEKWRREGMPWVYQKNLDIFATANPDCVIVLLKDFDDEIQLPYVDENVKGNIRQMRCDKLMGDVSGALKESGDERLFFMEAMDFCIKVARSHNVELVFCKDVFNTFVTLFCDQIISVLNLGGDIEGVGTMDLDHVIFGKISKDNFVEGVQFLTFISNTNDDRIWIYNDSQQGCVIEPGSVAHKYLVEYFIYDRACLEKIKEDKCAIESAIANGDSEDELYLQIRALMGGLRFPCNFLFKIMEYDDSFEQMTKKIWRDKAKYELCCDTPCSFHIRGGNFSPRYSGLFARYSRPYRAGLAWYEVECISTLNQDGDDDSLAEKAVERASKHRVAGGNCIIQAETYSGSLLVYYPYFFGIRLPEVQSQCDIFLLQFSHHVTRNDIPENVKSKLYKLAGDVVCTWYYLGAVMMIKDFCAWGDIILKISLFSLCTERKVKDIFCPNDQHKNQFCNPVHQKIAEIANDKALCKEALESGIDLEETEYSIKIVLIPATECPRLQWMGGDRYVIDMQIINKKTSDAVVSPRYSRICSVLYGPEEGYFKFLETVNKIAAHLDRESVFEGYSTEMREPPLQDPSPNLQLCGDKHVIGNNPASRESAVSSAV